MKMAVLNTPSVTHTNHGPCIPDVQPTDNPVQRKAELINRVSLPNGWTVAIGSAAAQGGYYFEVAGPDILSRRYPIEPDLSDNSLIDRIYMAAQTAAIDWLRRRFKLDGVTIYHPDNNIHAMVEKGRALHAAAPAPAKKLIAKSVETEVIEKIAKELGVRKDMVDVTRVQQLLHQTKGKAGDFAINPVHLLTPVARRAYAMSQATQAAQAPTAEAVGKKSKRGLKRERQRAKKRKNA